MHKPFRLNRDRKTRLAIFVANEHSSWTKKLRTIRLAINEAQQDKLFYSLVARHGSHSPWHQTYQKQWQLCARDNSYLKNFATFTNQVERRGWTTLGIKENYRMTTAGPRCSPGHPVWVELQLVCKTCQKRSTPFSSWRGTYPTSALIFCDPVTDPSVTPLRLRIQEKLGGLSSWNMKVSIQVEPKKNVARPMPRCLGNQRGLCNKMSQQER